MVRKIIRLSIVTLVFCFSCDFATNNSSALTYSSNVEVGFTFNPTISINLSGDLLVNNLISGGAALDSNTIDVAVSTNATEGYTLTATAGTSTSNTDLINQTNSSYRFTSIATNASLSSLTTDNTWGFSYSSDNGTNWSNYSGLPLDNNDEGVTGKQLYSTINPSDSKTIKFKIGAKASTSQPAGLYSNIINFYAVANPDPGRSYTVIYTDLGGHAMTIPTQQTGTTNSNQIVLSDDYPEDVDEYYYFGGWCDQSTTDDTCPGTIYLPGDDYDISLLGQDVTIELYAIWFYDETEFCNNNPDDPSCDSGGGGNPGELDCTGPIPDPECLDPGGGE